MGLFNSLPLALRQLDIALENSVCFEIWLLVNIDPYLYLRDVVLSSTMGSSSLTKLLLSGCSLTNQALRALSEKTPGKLPCLVYLDFSSNEQLTTECLSSICTMTSSPGEAVFCNLRDVVDAKPALLLTT